MSDPRTATNPSKFACFLLVVMFVLLIYGIAIAAKYSLDGDEATNGNMPAWLVGLVTAFNTAFATNLGLKFWQDLTGGRWRPNGAPFSKNWNLWISAIAYLFVWAFATWSWYLAEFKPAEQIVAVIPSVSVTGVTVFSTIVVGLMTLSTARSELRSIFK